MSDFDCDFLNQKSYELRDTEPKYYAFARQPQKTLALYIHS